MAGSAILVPRFGFHTAVQQVVSAAGISVLNANPTFDFGGVVGCGVIVPGSSYGLRVSGIHGFSEGTAFANALRLVICSLSGIPDALLGVINAMPPAVGAKYQGEQGQTGSNAAGGGLLIPDLTTMAINSALADLFAANGLTIPGAKGAPNALTVHMDMDVTVGGNWDHIYTFEADPIMIPPNTSVAALFIAQRYTDLGLPQAGAQLWPGQSVGGALIGSVLTSPPPDMINGFTPARAGNVAVRGPLG